MGANVGLTGDKPRHTDRSIIHTKYKCIQFTFIQSHDHLAGINISKKYFSTSWLVLARSEWWREGYWNVDQFCPRATAALGSPDLLLSVRRITTWVKTYPCRESSFKLNLKSWFWTKNDKQGNVWDTCCSQFRIGELLLFTVCLYHPSIFRLWLLKREERVIADGRIVACTKCVPGWSPLWRRQRAATSTAKITRDHFDKTVLQLGWRSSQVLQGSGWKQD